MQVILLDKVLNLGNLGEVVKVKDGYARNFLIPSGRARRATDTAIKEFEARRAELEKQAADKLSAAQGQGEKLSGANVKLTQKAGVDGRLFGSVTNTEVADALAKQADIKLDKRKIVLDEPIKAFGSYEIRAKLGYEVSGKFTVTVAEE